MLLVTIKYINNEEEHIFESELGNFNITYTKDSDNSRCFLRCLDNTNLNDIITAIQNNATVSEIIISEDGNIIYQNTDWNNLSDITINGDSSHISKTIILGL